MSDAASASVIHCHQVVKDFDLQDEGPTWRLLFGKTKGPGLWRALDGVSLSIPKGTFAAVLGRNGAGKSTLLRVLGGAYAATSGRVIVVGRVGSIFELGTAGNLNLTGADYAERFLILQGIPGRTRQTLVQDIHDFAELGSAFHEPIYSYSQGMRARLFFAAATAPDSDVYLIDEVLAVGDDHFQRKCWHRLHEKLRGGASGVLVTHDWVAALRLCSYAYRLEAGRIVAQGPIQEILGDFIQKAPLEPEAVCFQSITVAGTPRCGESLEIHLAISTVAARQIAISYSIERLSIGLGWEVFATEANVLIDAECGIATYILKFDRLLLPSDTYILNMFLATPLAQGSKSVDTVFDARSWRYGNGIPLIVEPAIDDRWPLDHRVSVERVAK